MNRDEATRWAKEIQALAEGNTIQSRHKHWDGKAFFFEGWQDVYNPTFENSMFLEFRIKPEPRIFFVAIREQNGKITSSSPLYFSDGMVALPGEKIIKLVEVIE